MPETKPEKKSTLASALLVAQGKADALEKDARNAHHNYKYVSSDSMIAEARRVLVDAGLTLFTAGWQVDNDGPVVKIGAGNPTAYDAPCQNVKIRFELHHAESGENAGYDISLPCVVEKGRPPDKALFGALTEGLAYFCRGLLLIPRIDGQPDNTPSARNDQNYTPPPKAAKPSAPAKPGPNLHQRFSNLVKETFGTDAAAAVAGIKTVGAELFGDDFDGDYSKLDDADLVKLGVALRNSVLKDAAEKP